MKYQYGNEIDLELLSTELYSIIKKFEDKMCELINTKNIKDFFDSKVMELNRKDLSSKILDLSIDQSNKYEISSIIFNNMMEQRFFIENNFVKLNHYIKPDLVCKIMFDYSEEAETNYLNEIERNKNFNSFSR